MGGSFKGKKTHYDDKAIGSTYDNPGVEKVLKASVRLALLNRMRKSRGKSFWQKRMNGLLERTIRQR